MPNIWDPHHDIAPDLAARLIERQFPQLAPVEIARFGAGWDNLAFLVNGQFVFRFPRRTLGVALIERETRILPLLADRLPLAIPNPEFAGGPDKEFPYPFAGYQMIPGHTACQVDWSDSDRAANALRLGRFLRALHAIPVTDDDRRWAPIDDIGRADLQTRLPQVKERSERIAHLLESGQHLQLATLADQLAKTPSWPNATCWVHGDLYARHLIVGEAKILSGVIDWGDVHLGDPAVDICIAFSFLPPSALPAFRHGYGRIDLHTLDRARFRALFYGVVLIEYGTSEMDQAIADVGRAALCFALPISPD